MALAARVVIVHRRSEYSELLDRHATYGQAEFFLRSRGRDITDVIARHEAIEAAMQLVSTSLPDDVRQARVERSDLDRYLFAPEDIIVAVGQDGLVANVAKYLSGQPVVGVDPEPGRNAGVLVPHAPEGAATVVASVRSGHAPIHPRSMVQAVLDDGQKLVALNDLYIGDQGHQSSRYTLTVPDRGSERQSSSGIIVGTGTGSTGWTASIASDRSLQAVLPMPESAQLSWFVREAWPSRATSVELSYGDLAEGQQLELVAESDLLVTFGDGIEHDRLSISWGQRLSVGVSDHRLNLVVAAS
ncbi:NAD(+)/NADH kinase [soil metagenome]